MSPIKCIHTITERLTRFIPAPPPGPGQNLQRRFPGQFDVATNPHMMDGRSALEQKNLLMQNMGKLQDRVLGRQSTGVGTRIPAVPPRGPPKWPVLPSASSLRMHTTSFPRVSLAEIKHLDFGQQEMSDLLTILDDTEKPVMILRLEDCTFQSGIFQQLVVGITHNASLNQIYLTELEGVPESQFESLEHIWSRNGQGHQTHNHGQVTNHCSLEFSISI